MLWFILCVAVLNMAAGFGLAVFLAGAYAGVAVHSCDHSFEDSAIEEFEDAFLSESDSPEPTEIPSTAATDEETETVSNDTDVPQPQDANVPQDADSPQDADASQDAKKPPESSEHSVMEDLDAAVSLALGDVALPESENAGPSSSQEEPPEGSRGRCAPRLSFATREFLRGINCPGRPTAEQASRRNRRAEVSPRFGDKMQSEAGRSIPGSRTVSA